MAERKQCEFQLIRYVPDPVKNEFVNIGVLLRAAEGEQSALRFTRDWGRVRCLDPDADTADAGSTGDRSRTSVAVPTGRPSQAHHGLARRARFPTELQITETKAYLAETFLAGLEDLMRLYVDSPRRERRQRRGGRAALVAAMRTHFEAAGVWTLMRKQIAAAHYTRPGRSAAHRLRLPQRAGENVPGDLARGRCRGCEVACLQRAWPQAGSAKEWRKQDLS